MHWCNLVHTQPPTEKVRSADPRAARLLCYALSIPANAVLPEATNHFSHGYPYLPPEPNPFSQSWGRCNRTKGSIVSWASASNLPRVKDRLVKFFQNKKLFCRRRRRSSFILASAYKLRREAFAGIEDIYQMVLFPISAYTLSVTS